MIKASEEAPQETGQRNRYRDLWAAVLDQAIKDYQSTDCRNLAAKNRRDAEAWLLSDKISVNSFAGVCLILDMDHRTVRRRILESGTIVRVAYVRGRKGRV